MASDDIFALAESRLQAQGQAGVRCTVVSLLVVQVWRKKVDEVFLAGSENGAQVYLSW